MGMAAEKLRKRPRWKVLVVNRLDLFRLSVRPIQPK
jgi:hypothetical protein